MFNTVSKKQEERASSQSVNWRRATYPIEARASKLTFVWKTPEFQPLESGVIYLQIYRLFSAPDVQVLEITFKFADMVDGNKYSD